MRLRLRHIAVSLAVAALASACTMVGVEPGAEAVQVIDEAQAASCQELGKTKVSVMGKIGIASRKARHVEAELDTLARNAGAELSGNAVVAAGPVEDGARKYRILRCSTLP